jgi:hypothetical protein
MTQEQISERGENVSPIQSLADRAQDLGLSIDRWNNAYMAFVACAVVLAAFVFVSQFVVIRKARLLNSLQEQISKDKDLQIAKAQKEAAEAQLALKTYVDRVAKSQEPRWANLGKLADLLKGKPKAPVEILFQPNDPEASTLAGQLHRALQIAGWSAPKPRTINLGDDEEVRRLSPLVNKNVGLIGVQVLAKNLPAPAAWDGTPVGELIRALGRALPHSPFTPMISTTPDAQLPKDLIVILVGQKQ